MLKANRISTFFLVAFLSLLQLHTASAQVKNPFRKCETYPTYVPYWSQKGIVYDLNESGICLYDPVTQDAKRIQSEGHNPALSDDGQLAYQSKDYASILIIDQGKTEPSAMVRGKDPAYCGKNLIYIDNRDRIVGINGQVITVILESTQVKALGHPSCTQILDYIYFDADNGKTIWKLEVSTGKTIKLIDDSNNGTISNDGKYLVFVGSPKGFLGLHIYAIETQRVYYLGVGNDPAFSPDGKQLVFKDTKDKLQIADLEYSANDIKLKNTKPLPFKPIISLQ